MTIALLPYAIVIAALAFLVNVALFMIKIVAVVGSSLFMIFCVLYPIFTMMFWLNRKHKLMNFTLIVANLLVAGWLYHYHALEIVILAIEAYTHYTAYFSLEDRRFYEMIKDAYLFPLAWVLPTFIYAAYDHFYGEVEVDVPENIDRLEPVGFAEFEEEVSFQGESSDFDFDSSRFSTKEKSQEYELHKKRSFDSNLTPQEKLLSYKFCFDADNGDIDGIKRLT